MSKNIQSVRGMHDLLPADSFAWQRLEAVLLALMKRYGYEEIRMPLLEKTELFARSIGDVTDIVEKEMYTFEDRNGDSLSLRPEGTASCVRAGIQHGLLHNSIQRLWYMGTMYRHERPQKGRYREFRQLGVEVFGLGGSDIEAELILMTARLWRELGITDMRLELNSLGMSEERKRYVAALVEFLSDRQAELDEDSQRRLMRNPMRILDSKNPAMKTLIAEAPGLADYFGPESKDRFARLLLLLDQFEIPYQLNSRLVRGLDYYSHTVFEWISDELGAQGTVCAGGRYDTLVEQLGGSATPAVGFAMGLERLLALLLRQSDWQKQQQADIYVLSSGEAAKTYAMQLVEMLRDVLPPLSIVYHCGAASLKSQLKRADRSGADLALILGDDELAGHLVTVKQLRKPGAQETVAYDSIYEHLNSYFNKR